jgi:hypothetical protein
MKKDKMKKTEKDENTLHFRPREEETISIDAPLDALNSLKKIASARDMSYRALIKFYVGQGLRQDLSKFYADRVLETTAEVLARHIPSKKEVSAIIQEIRETKSTPKRKYRPSAHV